MSIKLESILVHCKVDVDEVYLSVMFISTMLESLLVHCKVSEYNV